MLCCCVKYDNIDFVVEFMAGYLKLFMEDFELELTWIEHLRLLFNEELNDLYKLLSNVTIVK